MPRRKQEPTESTAADQSPVELKTERTISVPVLVGTLLVLIVGGAALYFWHGLQVERGADSLLARATELEVEADYSAAASYIFRYTRLRPGDTEAQITLAQMYGQSADEDPRRISRAVQLYYQALAVADDANSNTPAATRDDIRTRLTDLLVKQGEFIEAESQARKLPDGNPQADRLLALALVGRVRSGAVTGRDLAPLTAEMVALLRRLTQHPDPELAEIFAQLLRSTDIQDIYPAEPPAEGESPVAMTRPARAAEADQLMTTLVEQAPDDPQAWLARYRYLDQFGSGNNGNDMEIENAIQNALRCGPDQLLVRLTAAEHELDKASASARSSLAPTDAMASQNDADPTNPVAAAPDARLAALQSARDHFQHIRDSIEPANQAALRGLGRVEVLLDNPDRAITIWQNALSESGQGGTSLDKLAIRWDLVSLLLDLGRFDDLTAPASSTTASPDGAAQDTRSGGLLADLQTDIARLDLRSDRNRFGPLKRSFNLLQAQYLAGTGKDAQALPLLGSITASQATSDQERKEHYQAYLLTAQCQQRIGRSDLAGQAFEAAAAAVATTSPAQAALARLQGASAWQATGAIDAAIESCRQTLNGLDLWRRDIDRRRQELQRATQPPQSDVQAMLTEAVQNEQLRASAQLLLASNLFTQQAQLSAGQHDWTRFREAFDRVLADRDRGLLQQDWRVDLLSAQFEWIQGIEQGDAEAGRDTALTIARQTEEQHPDDVSLLEPLVTFYQQLQRPDDADRALSRLQTAAADSATGSLAAARLQIQRREFAAAKETLQAALSTAQPNERLQIERTLARLAIEEGDKEGAATLLAEISSRHPDDPTVLQLRWQVAESQGDAAVKALAAEMEGNSQDTNEALLIQRLLGEASVSNEEPLRNALTRLERLEKARPRWSATYTLRGQLEDKRGNADAAIRAFQEAIRLGDRRLAVIERLIALLYDRRDFSQASQYLAQVEKLIPSSSVLSTVAMSLAVQNNQFGSALTTAQQSVEARPNDAMARMWYGQLLMSNQQLPEAEQQFLTAVKVAPQDVRLWNALFAYYIRADESTKARETLAQMMAQPKLTAGGQAEMAPGQREFVRAQALQLLGDVQEAEASYRKAMNLSPDDLTIPVRLASLYLSQPSVAGEDAIQKAIDVLEQATQTATQRADRQGQGSRDRNDPVLPRLKQMVSELQRSRGGEESLQDFLAWLKSVGGDDLSPDDRRMEARFRINRDGRDNLEQARAILEELANSPDAIPADRLVLAQTQERLGDLDGARANYLEVARNAGSARELIAPLVDFLIRRNDLREADTWQQQLERSVGSEFNAGVLQLRARLLAAQGRAAEGPSVVEPIAQRHLATISPENRAERAQHMAAVAQIYSQVQLFAAAEPWCRRRMEIEPQQFPPLAFCLAQQNRVAEALDVCFAAAGKYPDSPVPTVVISGVLVTGKPSTADFERAEPVLLAAETKYHDNANVLFEISNARFIQDRKADAIRLLKRVVELDPKNVIALNNLATIMAEDPTLRAEAHKYIDQAIAHIGARPDLYDTKGTIYIYDNEPEKAVELLEFAVASLRKDPRHQFHLAVAYFKLNRLDEATRHFQESLSAGLESQILTATDRDLINQLRPLLTTDN